MRMLYTLKYTPVGHYVLEFTISVDNVFLLASQKNTFCWTPQKLFVLIIKYPNLLLLVWGDFNIIDPSLDRCPPCSNNSAINTFMQKILLIDIWRVKNPKAKLYME